MRCVHTGLAGRSPTPHERSSWGPRPATPAHCSLRPFFASRRGTRSRMRDQRVSESPPMVKAGRHIHIGIIPRYHYMSGPPFDFCPSFYQLNL